MKLRKLFLAVLPMMVLSSCAGIIEEPTSSSEPENHEHEEDPTPHTHSFGGAWQSDPRDHWKICDGEGCNEIGLKGHHEFSLVETIAATCNSPEQKVYRCDVCSYEKIVSGHEFKAHNYVRTVTKVADCQHDGEITFSCTECDDFYTHSYSDPDAHHFGHSHLDGNVTVYECDVEGCQEEKRVMAFDDSQATVSKDDLQATGEIELSTASIAFDEATMASLGENIKVEAEPATLQDLDLPEEIAAKIGDNEVLDFTLTDGDEEVNTFDGKLTITVPYVLKENETEEGVVVWNLDQGDAIPMEAKFSNNQVSFETTHFSLYTVVHLTPEEVCELFGHNMVKANHTDSTCTRYGYEDEVCTRCGHSHRTTLPLANHEYELVNKKEPSHTEEGYFEYKCKNCDSSYRTAIAKLSNSDRGFYFNFLRSLGTSDIKMNGVMTQGNRPNPVTVYFGRDMEGLPFYAAEAPYYSMNGNSGTSIAALYKGYTLSSSSFYSEEAPVTLVDVLTNFGAMADLVPGSVSDKIEEIGEWVVEHYFLKQEAPEGYLLTLNTEAVQETVDAILEDSLGDALALIFGEDFYEEVLLNYLSKAYNNTIGEIIAELEEEGFMVDELYDAVVSILRLAGMPEDQFPTLDEILTDDVKAARIIDMIGGEDSPIPATYEEAKEMIDSFLAHNIFEIFYNLGMIRDQETIAESIAMDRAIYQNISMSVKTSSTGAFVSYSFALAPTDMGDGAGVISLSMDAVKDFDKFEIIPELDELASKCDLRQKAFTLDSNNYKWFVEPYEEQFNTTFEYRIGYVDAPYYGEPGEKVDALVSKDAVIKHRDYQTGQEYSSKLVIALRDELPYYYGNVMQNKEGFGTRVAKDDYGVQMYGGNLYYGFYAFFKNADGLDVTEYLDWDERYSNNLESSYEYLYSFTTNKVYHTDGSFDYLYAHSWRYTIVDEEEYVAYNGYRPNSSSNEETKRIYFKKTCDSCGTIVYDYHYVTDTIYQSSSNIGSSSCAHRSMNDQALEHLSSFGNLAVYYVAGRIEYRLPDYVYQKLGATSVSYGNATTSWTVSTSDCTNVYSWKIRVNNEVIKNGSFQAHNDAYCHYYTRTDVVDACHTRITHYKKCEICKKSFYDWSEVRSHHEHLEVVAEIKGTETQAGYSLLKCTACGELDFEQNAPHCHESYHYEDEWDEENEVNHTYFVCNDCDYRVEVTDPNRPLVLFEDRGESDGYLEIGYLFYGVYYDSQRYTGMNNYSFYYGYVFEDEDGELMPYRFVPGKVYRGEDYLEYDNSRYYYETWGILFDLDEIENMNNQLNEEDETPDLQLAIMCVSNYSGTMYIYVI